MGVKKNKLFLLTFSSFSSFLGFVAATVRLWMQRLIAVGDLPVLRCFVECLSRARLAWMDICVSCIARFLLFLLLHLIPRTPRLDLPSVRETRMQTTCCFLMHCRMCKMVQMFQFYVGIKWKYAGTSTYSLCTRNSFMLLQTAGCKCFCSFPKVILRFWTTVLKCPHKLRSIVLTDRSQANKTTTKANRRLTRWWQ